MPPFVVKEAEIRDERTIRPWHRKKGCRSRTMRHCTMFAACEIHRVWRFGLLAGSWRGSTVGLDFPQVTLPKVSSNFLRGTCCFCPPGSGKIFMLGRPGTAASPRRRRHHRHRRRGPPKGKEMGPVTTAFCHFYTCVHPMKLKDVFYIYICACTYTYIHMYIYIRCTYLDMVRSPSRIHYQSRLDGQSITVGHPP